MAQSETSIANRALQLLGASVIMNMTDNTPEAREASRCYDFCRRAEMRAHLWNFAVKRAPLAASSTAPSFGFKYQFPLPSDCLRVTLPSDYSLDWKVEGRNILTNWASSPFLGAFPRQNIVATDDTTVIESSGPILYLTYISDIQDPTLFDACFCETLAIRMALAMCERLTQSNTKQQLLDQKYRMSVSEARQVDALENLPEDPPYDSLLLSRVR